MLKLQKIYVKKLPSEAGFTLLEVLVAMLIATFFVIGSMQALVLSTALRVKAQEKQRANQLIQEDIEQILFEAETLAINNSLCSATTFDTDSTIYDSIDDATRDSDPDSYAESLWEDIPSVPNDKQLLDGKGKIYRLSRTHNGNSTAKVLKIDFSVQEWNGSALVGDVIATDHIEVIPNAAIEQCPN